MAKYYTANNLLPSVRRYYNSVSAVKKFTLESLSPRVKTREHFKLLEKSCGKY